MKKSRSLKSELIYDLSLLTFCSLILSSGLLVLLIRINYPVFFEPQARLLLEGVHRSFLDSTGDLNKIGAEKLHEDFASFSKKHLDGDSSIRFSMTSELLEAPRFSVTTRKVLFFLKSPIDYQLDMPVTKNLTFHYQLDFSDFHSFLDRYKYIVFIASLIISAILVLIGYQLLFRKNILIPIQNLSRIANAFLNEHWNVRYEVQRNDELGQIGEALNGMAKKIVEKERKLVLSIQSLQKANEEIETTKNEQLQIEKLASVGRLAAGVAHEVGNPLGAISGYIDILQRSLGGVAGVQDEDRELLNRIESETNRISRIIRALLQQARPPQDRIRLIHLKPVIEKAVELAQIGSNIQLDYDFEDKEAQALSEKDQLVQVLLNLLINARHAIEAKFKEELGGKIAIRCAERKIHSGMSVDQEGLDSSTLRQLDEKTYWMIRITDNGTGIDKEDQKKLFEPFFSTKETGKGTGLGLYVAKSIIESFRGVISVQSEPGYGTSFSVFLPKDL